MSGATTELNLRTAVDADDNADYLTLDLANSLRTIDALFNNVTGHNHTSAHQGGPLTIGAGSIADGSITSVKIADGSILTADLADGSVTSAKLAPPIDINGYFRSTGAPTAPPSGTGLELYYQGAGIVQGYNRTNSTYADLRLFGSKVTLGINGGNSLVVNTDGSVAIAGGLTSGGHTASALTVSGNATLSGVTSAQAISCTTLTASGNISSGGTVSASAVTSTGAVSGNTVSAGGAVSGDSGTFTNGIGITSYSSYFLWAAQPATSIWCDGSVMQFASQGTWRWLNAGRTVSIGVGTLANAASAFIHQSSVYISAGNGLVVGGNDLKGQSFYVAGGAGGPTGWQTISSIRWKSSNVAISDALDIVTNPGVHGYHFQLDHPELLEPTQQYGFIGEEWLTVAPDVVNTDSEGEVLFMDYGQITPIIYEALKGYIARTDARLAALEAGR